MADRRFPTSFKDVPDADDPGLVLGDDNVVYLVKPDGSRVEVGAGGSSDVLSASVTLAHADILALPTTPVEIVAAPGAGKIIVPLFSAWVANTSGGAYTNFNAFSAALPYASSVYLAWDGLNNFNDASGPIRADRMLGQGEIAYANVGAISGQLLSVNGGNGNNAIEYGADAQSVGNGYENVPVHVVGQNNNLGDFTGGDVANTLKVKVAYFLMEF